MSLAGRGLSQCAWAMIRLQSSLSFLLNNSFRGMRVCVPITQPEICAAQYTVVVDSNKFVKMPNDTRDDTINNEVSVSISSRESSSYSLNQATSTADPKTIRKPAAFFSKLRNHIKNWTSSAQDVPPTKPRANLVQAEKSPGAVFGQPLGVVERSESGIPKIIEDCTNHLLNCVDTEGLFRISASLVDIKNLKEKYDKRLEVDLTDQSPHTVAALLKMYLRELPEPLAPKEICESLKTLNFDDNDFETIRRVVAETMNRLNIAVLLHISHFLKLVSQHSSQNKMDSQNLAVVFAPNMLGHQHLDISSRMMDLFIRNYDDIWGSFDLKSFLAQYYATSENSGHQEQYEYEKEQSDESDNPFEEYQDEKNTAESTPIE